MGKRSVKENKNIYQIARETCGMSRQAVEDATSSILTERKLEKIEGGTQPARAEEVLEMAKMYHAPELCNYYCTQECPIGKEHVPKVETIHDLPQIAMGLLSNLNSLNRDKDRIIDITADGKISDNEKDDFEAFRKHLDEMALAIESLKLWTEKTMLEK